MDRLWDTYMTWYDRQNYWVKVLAPSVSGVVLGTAFGYTVNHTVSPDHQWIPYAGLCLTVMAVAASLYRSQQRSLKRFRADFERRIRELGGS